MAAVKLLTFKAAVAAAAIGLSLAICLEARNTPWLWQTKNLPLRRRHTRLNANGIEKEMNASFYEIPRGGGESMKLDDDDFSTDYYDDVEEEYESDEQPHKEEEEEEESFGHPYEMEGRHPYPNSKRRTEENTVLFKRAKSLLQKSALVTANVASASLKQSGKAAYYLATPKYVKESELYGVWRLDQQLMEDDSFCSAAIEFTSHHRVIWGTTTDQVSTFRFTQRSWPRSCYIEFEAPIFRHNDDGDDSKPIVWMRYKGYFRRKIADPTVVKMIGTIYPITKKRRGLFGRAQQPTNNSGRIGTFTGRRRISLPFHDDSPLPKNVHNINDLDVEEYNDPYDEYDDSIDERD